MSPTCGAPLKTIVVVVRRAEKPLSRIACDRPVPREGLKCWQHRRSEG